MNTTLTTAQAAAVGGLFGAFAVFGVILYILLIIAGWRILRKAGEPGWKIIIPIYGLYTLYKIVNMRAWFWITFLLNCVLAVLTIAAQNDINAYNAGTLSASQSPLLIATVIFVFISAIFDFIVTIIYSYRLSKAFGHGIGFTIGLFFLPFIFQFVIAFSKDKYNKKAIAKD
ncbi:hypothetical protein IJ118_02480 [Candidatus Saccharibacteria bacterium]|nr:hypothetical protein [Candidatus Saccharibacteria bacterium]